MAAGQTGWERRITGPGGRAATKEHDRRDQGAADRLAPIGLTVPFHEADLNGELYLMSFAHTASGARLTSCGGNRSVREYGLACRRLSCFLSAC